MSRSANASTKYTSKKVKAFLAGGLVLGVGAAVTLAAWTDQEWAAADFHAGSFNLQSSVTGKPDDFHDHNAETGAATLNFQLPATGKLAPGEKFAAPFVLRLTDQTTVDAKVKLEEVHATESENLDHLNYGLIEVSSVDECNTTATSATPLVKAGTRLNSTGGSQPEFTLTAGDDKATSESKVLCFQIHAEESLLQNVDTSVQWNFAATSVPSN